MTDRTISDLAGVTGLTADSRQVRPGMLFAALPGSVQDGRAFIGQAIAAGARVILAPTGTDLPTPGHDGVRLITDPLPRRRFARLAAAFYGRQPDTVVAVTGTNGKTSTAQFARELWRNMGRSAGAIGTLGISRDDGHHGGALTTPDTVTLHRLLADLAGEGITHLAMEASSHGLDQYRLDGVRVAAAAFTNLTRDHLDYHHTMDAYAAAKARLFAEVLASDGTAIINADSQAASMMIDAARAGGRAVRTYGRAGDWIRLLDRRPHPTGQSLRLVIDDLVHQVDLPLVGDFQAMNTLAALGLVLATGANAEAALVAFSRLSGVRGRLEPVGTTPDGAAVYVDYAHTPDALATVLDAVRPHVDGRLVVLFGAGGDRDPGKRPEMGAIAARLADKAIVTDDNPRTETPASIRAAILGACPNATEIGDRAEAIETAIAALGAGDILVLAGKGHETYQEINGVRRDFDDAAVARQALRRLRGAS